MTNLKNKVALITGSARGIGKSIALRYASKGADIVVNYSTDKQSGDATVRDIKALGVKALGIQANVADVGQLTSMFETAITTFGKIDIVVANAGMEAIDLPVVDVTEELYDRLYSINVKGAFFTMQQAAKTVVNNGRIIYVGSTTADLPLPGIGLYGSTKAAPRYLVRVLALELGARGITVNGVIPTAIDGAGVFTKAGDHPDMREFVKKSIPMGRMGTAEDVADVAEFFAGDLSSFVSGQNLCITGGAIA
ncbi:MAG TPA: SDR family oxidoreductase [Kofleriaceae bacterium]|jgi:3-oxoacyl-[acyl-carrier protein] reductase|nr:SDR family oxidoreductase [Kofleriaceae bacterium]